MNPDVIVIGGGLSGLSAAVDLAARGHAVLVLEKREFLGGRAYSYLDRVTGDVVDNGQHLLMGCFKNTKRFLEMIGSLEKLTIQRRLEVTFFHPTEGFVRFHCPNLPAPFHLMIGLLRLKSLTFRDRVRLFRVIREISDARRTREGLANLTVEEWLTRCNQSEACKKYFWNVLATAVLNQKPEHASASLFRKVLRKAFLGRPSDSVLMVPNRGLSELYAENAREFIQNHHGQVDTRVEVRKIHFSRGRAIEVELKDAKRISAKTVISSIPPYSLRAIMQSKSDNAPRPSNDLDSVPASPIVTINLWLDREIMKDGFVSMLDSPIQWIFNKKKIFSNGVAGGGYLSCVISAAEELLPLSKDELVRLALDEVGKAYPEVHQARLVHSLVVKEKRATMFSTPASQQERLPARTQWENVYLAGDWTDTGLPATIESAVTSGFTAARLADDYLREKGR